MKQINYLLPLLLLLPTFSPAQILINEVMVKPGTNATSPQFQSLKVCTQPNYGSEYIELYNTNSCSSIDISCYLIGFNGNFLSTDNGTFRFPAGSIIPPLGFLSIGGPNSGATINLYNYCSTANLNTGNDRWYIPNGDGYVLLWNDTGTPMDAVYWTSNSGEANKWGTDSDIQLAPTFIASGTGCPNITSLQGPQNILISSPIVHYAGQNPSIGLVINRAIDGEPTWVSNAAPTVNNCNGACNSAGSTFSVNSASTNATCGANNGTATATPNPTGTYFFLWSANANNQTDSTATGLAAGTYFVTVTDTSGCAVVDTAVVANSGGPAVTTSYTPATCGSNNGTATANATGGTTPYTYNWSTTPAQTDSIATALSLGNYSVTVTDNSGCIIVAIVTVSGSPAVIVSITPETCSQSDGEATANVSGGTTPYSYLWSVNAGSQTTQTSTGLTAGNYSVTVTDSAGCTAIATATVTGGPTITVTANPSTCGNSDGNATANVLGGVTPYTYLWSNSQTTSTITGLAAGNYSVTITDANLCAADTTASVNNIDGPTLTTISTSATCGNNNGSATVMASGGASPYTYLWNNGQTAQTATGLSSGNFFVTVTDDNNCTAIATDTVDETSSSVYTVSTSICNGDSTFLQGNYQTTAGTYYDTLTSVLGCDSIVETTLTIYLTAAATATAAICNGDSILLQENYQTTAGTYYDTLTSVLGCDSIITATTLTVNQLPVLTVSEDTTISFGTSVLLSASATAASFLWSTNETTAAVTVSPLTTTTYSVTVTNTGGCVSVGSVKVSVDASLCNVYIPSLFTPNGDGVNEMFYVRGKGFTEMKFLIYNRWGEQVFQSYNINNGWDGTYKSKGQEINTAVFVYYFETTCINGEPLEEQGNITVIK